MEYLNRSVKFMALSCALPTIAALIIVSTYITLKTAGKLLLPTIIYSHALLVSDQNEGTTRNTEVIVGLVSMLCLSIALIIYSKV